MSSSWRQATIKFLGGQNVNPDVDNSPGEALLIKNYALDSKGYPKRMDGIERFDGQPAPSEFTVASSTDDDDYNTQLFAGIAARRALIAAVPGSGAVRGVAFFNNVLYAWRDNAAGTFLEMFQSSGAGWVAATGFPTGTLIVGGRIRTIKANFIGSSSGTKLYGVDGKNKAFMYDGATYTEITTGTPIDTPNHIVEHQKYLWLAFTGGSLQHSVVGEPTNFGGGAGEIGIGDEIVGLTKPPGGALLVVSDGRLDLIYGASASTFQRVDFNEEMGGFENTLQIVADAIIGNHQGFMVLPRTQDFGDFNYNTMSEKIQPALRFSVNRPVASCVVGGKNQYRVFFEAGDGYTATFKGNQLLGWSPFDYGIDKVASCLGKGNDSNKAERIFIGCENGFVYEIDKGRSLDGDDMEATFRMAYAAIGGPNQVIRAHKAVLEIDAQDTTEITVTPDYEFSSDDVPEAESQTVNVVGAGGFYDGAVYNQTKYGPYRQLVDLELDGHGSNMGILFHSLSNQELPHTLRSVTIYYTLHGRKR